MVNFEFKNPKMTTNRILNAQELIKAGLLSVGLGLTFAFGFIPTSQSLLHFIVSFFTSFGSDWFKIGEYVAFPLLSAFFFVSFPRPDKGTILSNDYFPWVVRVSLLPILISMVFGAIHPSPPFYMVWFHPSGRSELLWYLLCVPLGEELLFRGWLYELCERLWPEKTISLTNPIPVSVWTSSFAFSLWHLQNFSHENIFMVLFQIVYTFFAGVWLGYLRNTTGKIIYPCAAHFLLNLASGLF